MIIVAVVLVDGDDLARNVNDIRAQLARLPDKPVIPPNASDDKRRNLQVKTTPESKVIDGVRPAPDPASQCQLAKTIGGAGLLEMNGLRDVYIPAATDHEECLVGGLHALEGAAKLRQKNDVAIDVAEERVAGDLLRTGKHEIEPLGAKFVALHKRLVAQTEFAASFGRSGI